MQSAAILEKEVSDLRAENEKKKRNRTRSTRQISSQEGLTVSDASILLAQPDQAGLAQASYTAGPAPASLQPRTRALPTCSICGTKGHKLTTCPNKNRF
jgi:hypothetical protein